MDSCLFLPLASETISSSAPKKATPVDVVIFGLSIIVSYLSKGAY
jgi:hypothetical protein